MKIRKGIYIDDRQWIRIQKVLKRPEFDMSLSQWMRIQIKNFLDEFEKQ